MTEPIFKSTGPLPAEATFDALLTNTAVAWWQENRGDNVTDIFPVLPVDKSSGKYKVYERGAFYRDDVGQRPRGGVFPQTGFGMTDQSYSVEEEGISTPIDQRDLADSVDPTTLERGKTQLLTNQQRTHHMRLWAGKFFGAFWTANRAGVSSGPGAGQFLQFDQAGADPISYVRRERLDFHRSTGGFAANVMTVGADLHRYICDLVAVIERIKYSEKGIVTIELLKQLFEVDDYIVVSAVWNQAKEGAAEDMQFIANSRAFALFHRTPTPGDPHAPTAGRMIAWNALVPGGGKNLAVNRWRSNPYAENLDCRTAMGPHMVSADLGRFYGAAISNNA